MGAERACAKCKGDAWQGCNLRSPDRLGCMALFHQKVVWSTVFYFYSRVLGSEVSDTHTPGNQQKLVSALCQHTAGSLMKMENCECTQIKYRKRWKRTPSRSTPFIPEEQPFLYLGTNESWTGGGNKSHSALLGRTTLAGLCVQQPVQFSEHFPARTKSNLNKGNIAVRSLNCLHWHHRELGATRLEWPVRIGRRVQARGPRESREHGLSWKFIRSRKQWEDLKTFFFRVVTWKVLSFLKDINSDLSADF